MPPNIFIENVPTQKESHENLYLLLLYLINTYFKIKKFNWFSVFLFFEEPNSLMFNFKAN